MSSGAGKASVALTDNSINANNLVTYTFSNQSLGVAASDRKIIVGVAGDGGTAAVISVTVAGVSATNVVAAFNSTGHSEIWIADVPTGATGDVVVTFGSGGKARCGIGVYRAIGSQSAANATASSTADPMSASLSIPSNGIAVGAGQNSNGGSFSWTNLTERYDQTVEGDAAHTGASIDNLTAQTPTITCNPTAAGVDNVMTLASWSPT